MYSIMIYFSFMKWKMFVRNSISIFDLSSQPCFFNTSCLIYCRTGVDVIGGRCAEDRFRRTAQERNSWRNGIRTPTGRRWKWRRWLVIARGHVLCVNIVTEITTVYWKFVSPKHGGILYYQSETVFLMNMAMIISSSLIFIWCGGFVHT